MQAGERVIVKSFMGKKSPDTHTENEFNYWKLIGLHGTVIDSRESHPFYKDKGAQILVKFDKNLKDLGLHAHNEPPNSLWLFSSDIKKVGN
jgi:hypothetical protein